MKFHEISQKVQNLSPGAPGRGRLGPRFIYRRYVVTSLSSENTPRKMCVWVIFWISEGPRNPYFGVHFGPPRDPPWRAKSEKITKNAKFH